MQTFLGWLFRHQKQETAAIVEDGIAKRYENRLRRVEGSLLKIHRTLANENHKQINVRGEEKDSRDQRVVEYYKTHTMDETAKEFGISRSLLWIITHKSGFRKKNRSISVPNIVRTVERHQHLRGNAQRRRDKQVMEFYQTHTATDTANHFGISEGLISVIYQRDKKRRAMRSENVSRAMTEAWKRRRQKGSVDGIVPSETSDEMKAIRREQFAQNG